jgi:hypothetical protein
MTISRVELADLDLDAIAASFQAHIIREITDPRIRAQSLMALARSWWLAVAGDGAAGLIDDVGS